MPRIQGNPSQDLGISHAIVKVFREQNRLHGRAAQAFGLSTEQAHLLVVLWTYGPLTMTELGREVALSSGTLSAAVDRMETAGMVVRAPDPKDKRVVRVEPAPWPAKKRQALLDALRATEETVLAPLGKTERASLAAMLGKILAGLGATTR
jgi:DNA-binding MarR family transcriptional regulator